MPIICLKKGTYTLIKNKLFIKCICLNYLKEMIEQILFINKYK